MPSSFHWGLHDQAASRKSRPLKIPDEIEIQIRKNWAPQVRTLCLSPDGSLLLSIDDEGKALVVHRARRVLLHHVSFKAPVRAAKFSPDGKLVAVAVGKLLQVGCRGWG